MATMSPKARNLSLIALFGANKHASALATLYIALYVGDPFGAGVEPGATGNYSRAAVLNDSGLWGTIASTATQIANVSAITWPVATGAYSVLGPYNYWAIYDAPSAGNLYYGGPLTTTIPTTANGDQPRLPVGAFIITQGA